VTSPAAGFDLTSLDRATLERELTARGLPGFRARQLFQWIYQRDVTDFEAMTDLPRPLRTALAAELTITTPRLIGRERSEDGTEKFLLELDDERRIESVFIPDTPAMTFCVSTQVGCAMACAFCLTGRMGLVRNLTAAEIVGQVRLLAHALDLRDRAFNIVLMGMGEPLHNYDETMTALRILADPFGLAVPPRRVTLSTVGLVPAMDRLAAEPLMPNLAVSLHAATESLRREIVPIGRKYSIDEVIDACRRFPLPKRRRITFEYVLLAGVNDSDHEAHQLANRLAGLRAKVNVIPLNAAPGIPFERPSDAAVDRFAGVLASHHITVSVRKSRGRDIRAACGQLIVEGGRRSPAQILAAKIDRNED
jgi:23S rRNA (adenine2503-C2)-methyltransferase